MNPASDTRRSNPSQELPIGTTRSIFRQSV